MHTYRTSQVITQEVCIICNVMYLRHVFAYMRHVIVCFCVIFFTCVVFAVVFALRLRCVSIHFFFECKKKQKNKNHNNNNHNNSDNIIMITTTIVFHSSNVIYYVHKCICVCKFRYGYFEMRTGYFRCKKAELASLFKCLRTSGDKKSYISRIGNFQV